MQITFEKIEVQPTEHVLDGKKIIAVLVEGGCTLARWKAVYHFTTDGRAASNYPMFGCKNYDKEKFHSCVPFSTKYQTTPCPVYTSQAAQIKEQAVRYLIQHNFIDIAALSTKADPLVRMFATAR
jgi:hypothetical protein